MPRPSGMRRLTGEAGGGRKVVFDSCLAGLECLAGESGVEGRKVAFDSRSGLDLTLSLARSTDGSALFTAVSRSSANDFLINPFLISSTLDALPSLGFTAPSEATSSSNASVRFACTGSTAFSFLTGLSTEGDGGTGREAETTLGKCLPNTRPSVFPIEMTLFPVSAGPTRADGRPRPKLDGFPRPKFDGLPTPKLDFFVVATVSCIPNLASLSSIPPDERGCSRSSSVVIGSDGGKMTFLNADPDTFLLDE